MSCKCWIMIPLFGLISCTPNVPTGDADEEPITRQRLLWGRCLFNLARLQNSKCWLLQGKVSKQTRPWSFLLPQSSIGEQRCLSIDFVTQQFIVRQQSHSYLGSGHTESQCCWDQDSCWSQAMMPPYSCSYNLYTSSLLATLHLHLNVFPHLANLLLCLEGSQWSDKL